MDPAMIQELVLCAPSALQTVAKKHKLKPSTALVVRDHWVRRMTSRCVQCGLLVVGDACPQCKTPKQSAADFLLKVKKKDVVLRRECEYCGRPFYYSAGYILKSFKLEGKFKPSNKCPSCRMKKKSELTRVKTKKVRTPPTRKKPKAAKSAEPKNTTPSYKENLTQQPFEALKGLKLKI